MSTNFENSEENNRLSEVIFALLPENNIITNRAFLYAFNGNFLKASMLSRYTHCFINNGNKEITYKDKTFEEQYYCPEISVKRAKRELKEEGFITVVQKGIPAVGYITVNIEKVAGILGNFKKYQNDTTGNIYLIPLYNNKIKDNKNIKENTKRSLETEKNIPASGSPSSPKVDELSAKISSIKPKKVKKLKEYEKDEVFLSIRKSLPEYMNGCGPVKAYKAYLNATEKGTKNVEEIKKAILFYLKTLPEWQHPQHLSTFLNQGTWEEFYARAVEQEQKKEKARALREKQQKEEAEQRKRVLKERAQVFEAKYQILKNKLNAGYDTLEEISQENEELFYDVIQQIRDYERKLEEKETERKKQQELEQKKIEVENSKHKLEEAERELWTYISQVIDVNAYLDRNKKRFPNSYETFKALFSNGETLLDVVFGELAKDTVVERLKNNILSFLINEMSNEEARKLYNKRNDAWTKWNQLTKAIA